MQSAYVESASERERSTESGLINITMRLPLDGGNLLLNSFAYNTHAIMLLLIPAPVEELEVYNVYCGVCANWKRHLPPSDS